MQILTIIMLAISLFLAGTIAGMNLVDKMYRKTIESTARLIDEYEEMTEELKDLNAGLTQIINLIFSRNDYESLEHLKKWLKEEIKKTLGSAGKHKS